MIITRQQFENEFLRLFSPHSIIPKSLEQRAEELHQKVQQALAMPMNHYDHILKSIPAL